MIYKVRNKLTFAEEPIGLYEKSNYPFQEETFKIIGLCMEIHNELGCGFLEEVLDISRAGRTHLLLFGDG